MKKPATPEQISEAKAAWLNGGKRLDNLSIRFENVDDATLEEFLPPMIISDFKERIRSKNQGGNL